MKLFTLSFCLFLFFTSFAQRKPVPNLPVPSVEYAGFNRDSIRALYDLIDNFEQGDFRGLVVIKDNEISVEWYFNTFWRNHIHDIRSAGKSITSLLLGIAVKEGLVTDLDQDIYSFFSQEEYPDMHEDYKEITIRHLLDMSSGLDADSDRPDTPGQAGNWGGKDEWISYLLAIPMVEKPGERFVYADINAVLIGAIIEALSGKCLKDYAKEKLFDPLSIKEFYWYTNAANQTGGAGNLYLSTLDFAKFGTLLLNEGKWGEEQIVDADYINQILERKMFNISDWFYLADEYGMFWYKAHNNFNGRKLDYLFASGNGGNQLIVIPEENIVIAITASAYMQRYGHSRTYEVVKKVVNALPIHH